MGDRNGRRRRWQQMAPGAERECRMHVAAANTGADAWADVVTHAVADVCPQSRSDGRAHCEPNSCANAGADAGVRGGAT